jgi:hypothetical protein
MRLEIALVSRGFCGGAGWKLPRRIRGGEGGGGGGVGGRQAEGRISALALLLRSYCATWGRPP